MTEMIRGIELPEAIDSRTEYKRKFEAGEIYRAFVMIPGAVTKMIGNKRKKLLSRDFIERLQLAGLIFFPVALIHGIMRSISGFSNIIVNARAAND